MIKETLFQMLIFLPCKVIKLADVRFKKSDPVKLFNVGEVKVEVGFGTKDAPEKNGITRLRQKNSVSKNFFIC
jgi:hypothetical protein